MDLILIILLAIIFSAFFSGMEIAFVSSNRLRIELDRKQGVFGSRIIKLFTDNPGQYIATMLIGSNFSLVVYGLVISKVLATLLTPVIGSELLILLIIIFLSTAIILLVAEFLPKAIFVISPNFFLKFLSVPTLMFYLVFYPVSKITVAASNLFIRLFFKLNPSAQKQEDIIFSKVDLDHFLNHSNQIKEDSRTRPPRFHYFSKCAGFLQYKTQGVYGSQDRD